MINWTFGALNFDACIEFLLYFLYRWYVLKNEFKYLNLSCQWSKFVTQSDNRWHWTIYGHHHGVGAIWFGWNSFVWNFHKWSISLQCGDYGALERVWYFLICKSSKLKAMLRSLCNGSNGTIQQFQIGYVTTCFT